MSGDRSGGIMPVREDGKPWVSVISVTNRPLFTPGLLTMFRHQTWPALELVMVDGDAEARCMKHALANLSWLEGDRGFQYINVKPDTPVGAMRNIGMEMAHGEFMTWLDDDGWHAPHHIETMMEHLKPSGPYDAVGIQGLYWSDTRGDFYHYRGTPNFPISGSMVWHRRCFEKFRFETGHRKASDHYWINDLRMDNELQVGTVEDLSVCVAVSHGFNLSNPKPPSLARPISTHSWDDFGPGEEWGLKAHLLKIRAAVEQMGGVR